MISMGTKQFPLLIEFVDEVEIEQSAERIFCAQYFQCRTNSRPIETSQFDGNRMANASKVII